MDARDQEKSFEKLLARTLRKSLEPGGSDCPGPDLLAAYLERSLSDAEAARCEQHFAQCARCQQALAAADAGAAPQPAGHTQAPATEMPALRMAAAPAAQPMEMKAAVPSILGGPQEVRPRRRHWSWRWLVPAVGAAAAVALWIAVRPQTRAPVAHQPSEALKEIAQNNPPAAPASETLHSAGTESKAKPSAQALARESRPTKAGAQPSREDKQTTAAVQPRAGADRLERRAKTLSAEASRQENAGATGSRDAALARKDQPGQPLAAEQKEETDKTAAAKAQPGVSAGIGGAPQKTGTGQTAAAQPGAGPMPPPAASAAKQQAEEKRQDFATGVMAARVGGRRTFILISSPNASVQWRVGPAGSIARSGDAGRTWQAQASYVTADLAGGSAPSQTVCWVVGRAGTILRTTDGEHWEKVFSPAQTDWIALEARDALNATVVAANRQRYVTSDGGQSWRGPLGK